MSGLNDILASQSENNNNNTNKNYESTDEFVHYSMTICGSISILSTAILIIYYALSPASRSFGFRLVLPLFIWDCIWSTNIVSPLIYLFFNPTTVLNDVLCKLQGFIAIFSMLASFFSTAAVTWTLYTYIIRKKPIKDKKNNPFLHFAKYTVVIPFFLALIPIAFDRYDHLDPLSSVMCFLVLRNENPSTGTTNATEGGVNSDYTGILLRVFLYYAPFILVLLFDIVAVVRIKMHFRKNFEVGENQKKDVQNLMLYPIVLFCAWILILIERIIEVIQDKDVQWLNEIDLTVSSLNGFLNALVYGYISLDPFGFRKEKIHTIQPKKQIGRNNKGNIGLQDDERENSANQLYHPFVKDKQSTYGKGTIIFNVNSTNDDSFLYTEDTEK